MAQTSSTAHDANLRCRRDARGVPALLASRHLP